MQRGDARYQRLVTFASSKMMKHKVGQDRVAYAVIWKLGRFEAWTYGTSIILYTDHNPPKYLTKRVPKNTRLHKWPVSLSRYLVSVAHKPAIFCCKWTVMNT